MAISTQISRLTTLRNNIRTKLISLGILPSSSSSATLSQCYSALSNVVGLGATSYTPTTATQTISAGRYLMGAQTINAIPSSYIIPSGTFTASSNSTYNIASYSNVSVNVPLPTRTATIQGNGVAFFTYVAFKGTQYYTNGNSFTFHEGDTVTLHAEGTRSGYGVIYINGVKVKESYPAEYTFTLPFEDVTINITTASSASGVIDVAYLHEPSGTYSITSNGTYNVAYYASASVNVPIPSGYIIPSGTITLSFNGTFDVGSYASADVTVTGCPSGNYLEYIPYGTSSSVAMFHFLSSDKKNNVLPNALFAGVGTYITLSSTSTIAYLSNPNNLSYNVGANTFYSTMMFRDGFDESNIYKIEGVSALCNLSFVNTAYSDDTKLYKDLIFTNLSYVSGYSIFNFFGHVSIFNRTIRFPALKYISTSTFCTFNTNVINLYFPEYSGEGGSCAGFGKYMNVYMDKLSLIKTNEMFSGHTSGLISIPMLNTISANYVFASVRSDVSIYGLSTLITIRGNNNFARAECINNESFPMLTTISGIYNFASCPALTTISFPMLTTISGSSNFYTCDVLTSVYFPKYSYTGLTPYMFERCYSLSFVSFPATSRLSGAHMFRSCYNLISMFLLGSSICQLGNTIASMFGSTPVSTYSTSAGRYASIFVPRSLVTSYKAATNWTTISSKIVAYEDYFDSNGNPL